LLILPCELIDNNGDTLKEIVLKLAENWGLEEDFAQWVEDANIFYNTLVDRIVTGYPKDNIDDLEKELGYEDDFLVQGEIFHLWVIEGPNQIKEEFPADKLGLNVLFVDDLTPYRERKVRILNGAHTSMVPVSYLYGLETVRESIEDEVVGKFIKSAIYDEIIPTLDLREEELLEFADAVVDRFKNPFINHYLMDISLNSMSKFKTRVLPSLLEYNKRKDTLPEKLVFSLAALIYFYKGERKGERINLSDDKEILTFYKEIWNEYNGTQESIETIVEEVLGLESLWEEDLNNIVGLKEKTVDYLGKIIDKGMEETLKEMV
ncbi:MAG TPA: tagaturonate reductase, partial [Tissierellaceae bacterium]|nr:tagaturonate reductase [Tissierellaceae bacterium]